MPNREILMPKAYLLDPVLLGLALQQGVIRIDYIDQTSGFGRHLVFRVQRDLDHIKYPTDNIRRPRTFFAIKGDIADLKSGNSKSAGT